MTEPNITEIEARWQKATKKPIPGFPGYEADDEGRIWSTTNWRGIRNALEGGE
jgi:hypothetical protein